jgi:hypothetical protein
MWVLNATLDRTFDVLLGPLRWLPPFASLLVVSLVTAVAMLLAIRKTSNQQAIEAVKRRIHAGLFEIRLFNDDLRAIFRAQAEMLRHNLTYLRLSLAPMVWMIVPFVLVMAQLQFHYGYDGLETGRPVLLTAHLRSGEDRRGGDIATLDVPSGIRSDTGAVWFPSALDVMWRITPEAPGNYELRLHVGGQAFTKTIHVSSRVARRSPSRLAAGFLDEILYPAEPPLPPDGPIASISVAYPERDINVFGWRINWMIVFFVLSIVFAFALKKPFGVTL